MYNEEEKERLQQLSAQLTAVAGPLQQIDEDTEQLQIEDINQNAWARQLQDDCIHIYCSMHLRTVITSLI